MKNNCASSCLFTKISYLRIGQVHSKYHNTCLMFSFTSAVWQYDSWMISIPLRLWNVSVKSLNVCLITLQKELLHPQKLF